MSLIHLPITTRCVISQLELLDKDNSVIKENLFNWVVEMDQFEFNRLCCEIIGVYEFWKKFDGVKVSDERDVLLPYLEVLPKIEIIVRPTSVDFSQKLFYQWLKVVNEFTLQDMCIELEMLWDQAIENINAYVIDSIFPLIKNSCEWWQLSYFKPEHDSDVNQMLNTCKGFHHSCNI